MKKVIYSLVALLVLLIGWRHFKPIGDSSAFDRSAFAELPVQVGGRIKPLDSVARNALLVLASRQKVETIDGRTLSPIEWFMDVTMRPEVADTHPVFKIEFPDDLGIAGLAQPGERYYAFNDLLPHLADIQRLHQQIEPEPKKRQPYEQQLDDLSRGLTLYHKLMHALHAPGDGDHLNTISAQYADYSALIRPGLQALRQQQKGEEYDALLLKRFIAYGENYLSLSQTAHLRLVPPPPPADLLVDWKNIGLELLDATQGNGISPYVHDYAKLTEAYRGGDSDRFNETVTVMQARFAADYPDDIGRVHFELSFNNAQIFPFAMQLYVLVFLIVCIAWLRWPAELGRAAFWVLLLAFILHSYGLVARMYIQGRPPVTNLYSSAVFVGWGAVLLGAFLERFFKNGIGAGMAALVGFATLIIAHHLAMSGDTLEMMRAVLDSNFWLATHVIIITFGYSAMFFAGALAIVFILKGLLDKSFDQDSARSLSAMVYGITCFAALFSLVGTILGGIWGDQSWGRFWGWDPKENGALMIVLMCAIYLHARWGGVFQERGLMGLAICGNIVTAWSWFGTNLLGVGLHSYGFTDSGFKWMALFILTQLLFIALGALPWKYWRSAFGRNRYERKRILLARAS
ncbi:MAG: cytochrome C biogenesis protein [Coraliomargarita sp. TMED73]|nr:MAG: cytochrome C biogenesis protein [Coraliomargarita sp. TMED73]